MSDFIKHACLTCIAVGLVLAVILVLAIGAGMWADGKQDTQAEAACKKVFVRLFPLFITSVLGAIFFAVFWIGGGV